MRSKQEIRADILIVAKNGVNKTRLVYGSYLNFKILSQHLRELIKGNLIVKRDGKYFTTETGLCYIQHVEAIT